MASYYAFFDFVLFVPLDENYNLGYSLIRRIPEVVVDVMAFAIGAGSDSGVRNASGRPYPRHSLLRRHSLLERLWRRFAIGAHSLLERIRYWYRTRLVTTNHQAPREG